MVQVELPRGSSALQRLAVAAEAGTATSSRRAQDERLGTGADAARYPGLGRCATPSSAVGHRPPQQQQPAALGARPASSSLSAATMEQLTQLLHNGAAGPLAAALHAPPQRRRLSSSSSAAAPLWPSRGADAAQAAAAAAHGGARPGSSAPRSCPSPAGCSGPAPGSLMGRPLSRASAHQPQDARLLVRPHRTAPYKSGMLLTPAQLTADARPSTAAAASAARPSTANPITHNLIDQRDSRRQASAAAAPAASRLGSGPAAAEQLPFAASRLRTPAPPSRGGFQQQQQRPATSQELRSTVLSRQATSQLQSLSSPSLGGGLQREAEAQGCHPRPQDVHSQTEGSSEAVPERTGSPEATGRSEGRGAGEQQQATTAAGTEAGPAPGSQLPGEGGAGLQGQPQQRLEQGRGAGALGLSPLAPGSPGSSRPGTASSNYSTQVLALGKPGGGGGGGPAGRGGWGRPRGLGSVLEEDCDVDSVDLTLQRIRRDNLQQDEGASVDLVGDVSMADLDEVLGLGGRGSVKLRHGAAMKFPGAKARALSWEVQRSRARAAMGQAAPMVLSLEDLAESTPEVLEMEMGRMSLEELLELDARVSAAVR